MFKSYHGVMKFNASTSRVPTPAATGKPHIVPTLRKFPFLPAKEHIEKVLLPRQKKKTFFNSPRNYNLKKYLLKMWNFQKRKNAEGVMNTLDDMRILKVEPHFMIYCYAINAVVRGRRVDRANEIYQEMKEKGFTPPTTLLSFLIFSQRFAQPNVDLKMAQYYFDELVALHPNANGRAMIVAYTNLLTIYSRCDNEEGMLRVFNDLQMEMNKIKTPETEISGTSANNNDSNNGTSNGKPANDQIRPSQYVYGAMMKLYSRRQELKKCLDLVNEMKLKGLKVNRVHYSMLMKSCRMPEEKEMMLQLFDDMRDLKIHRDLNNYGCVMSKLLQAGDYKRIYEYYDRLTLMSKLKPNRFIFNILLKAAELDNLDVGKMRHIMREMPNRGCKIDDAVIEHLVRVRQIVRESKLVKRELIQRAYKRQTLELK